MTFEVADVEATAFPAEYDLAFSRMGTMFFANPVAALRHVRGALVPGGRLCMVVWRQKAENDWMYRVEQAVERFVEEDEDSDEPTCGPGPFSMANADTTSGILKAAGFEQISAPALGPALPDRRRPGRRGGAGAGPRPGRRDHAPGRRRRGAPAPARSRPRCAEQLAPLETPDGVMATSSTLDRDRRQARPAFDFPVTGSGCPWVILPEARSSEERRDGMTLTKDETEVDALAIDTIRTLSMDGVQKANSGHPGAPMALAPVAYQLFAKTMKHNPADPDWFDRDRFVLSAGHASMLLYSILHLTGYGISMDDLKNFRQILSPTAGHPEYEADGTPGIEVTTGPLGQGVGNAVGFALAERLLAARFNRDGHEVIDHHTYAIASDGDMQEGVASEASSLAGHLGLGKLTVFYDNNQIQLAGPTSMGFSEKVGDRYEAYNWHVQDLGEDLSTRALAEAIEAAHADDRPSLIIVQSHIGFGSPNKQDSQKAHGSPLGEDEVKLTKEAYGWDPDKTFYVPDEAKEAYAEVPERGKQLQSEWEERLSAFRDAHGDLAAELDQFISGELPDGWDADLPRFSPDDDDIATRKASEQVIQWAAKALPTLVSGSADLEPSTNTEIEDGGSVTRDDFSGRNVHYGVREHGMGAIVNGLNRHGVRAFGSTFFNFLDYMKGSGAPGRADGAGRDPRVHARLDRPGRGRPDPPAGRAAGAPARHAERELRASRRRQRDGAGVEVRAGVHRGPDRAGASAARASRSWTRTPSRPTRSRRAPTCCATPRRRT